MLFARATGAVEKVWLVVEWMEVELEVVAADGVVVVVVSDWSLLVMEFGKVVEAKWSCLHWSRWKW